MGEAGCFWHSMGAALHGWLCGCVCGGVAGDRVVGSGGLWWMEKQARIRLCPPWDHGTYTSTGFFVSSSQY